MKFYSKHTTQKSAKKMFDMLHNRGLNAVIMLNPEKRYKYAIWTKGKK